MHGLRLMIKEEAFTRFFSSGDRTGQTRITFSHTFRSILQLPHGSGKVERQWSNSDVSSGATTGSSLSFGLYWVVSFVALPLLRCVCTFAASYTACSWGPCWLTIALRYLHHGWQPCECWVHLPVGSWPLWQVCPVPLPQVIWLVPCPEGHAWLFHHRMLAPPWCLAGWIGCPMLARQPSKK